MLDPLDMAVRPCLCMICFLLFSLWIWFWYWTLLPNLGYQFLIFYIGAEMVLFSLFQGVLTLGLLFKPCMIKSVKNIIHMEVWCIQINEPGRLNWNVITVGNSFRFSLCLWSFWILAHSWTSRAWRDKRDDSLLVTRVICYVHQCACGCVWSH